MRSFRRSLQTRNESVQEVFRTKSFNEERLEVTNGIIHEDGKEINGGGGINGCRRRKLREKKLSDARDSVSSMQVTESYQNGTVPKRFRIGEHIAICWRN